MFTKQTGKLGAARLLGILALMSTLASSLAGSSTPALAQSGSLLSSPRSLITANDASANDVFGSVVATNGELKVVGAPDDDERGTDSGAAYVFARNQGGRDRWGQVAKLLPPEHAPGAHFGAAVALDGDHIVVGAPQHDIPGKADAGATYLFVRNQAGQEAWMLLRTLAPSSAGSIDNFGTVVSISGDTIAVSAPANGTGAIHIFAQNTGGANAWGQVRRLTVPQPVLQNRLFGTAIALDGDTLLVGAPGSDTHGTNSGTAYIFTRHQGGPDAWGLQRELTSALGFKSDADDLFGSAVAVDGDTVLVGAPGDECKTASCGAAYIFRRNAGGPNAWGRVNKLRPADGAEGDQVGAAVALWGDVALLGAPGTDANGTNRGRVYVHRRNLGGADIWGEHARLIGPDGRSGDAFGQSVALSGDLVVAGAPLRNGTQVDSGASYLFTLDSERWSEILAPSLNNPAIDVQFGTALARDGDTLVVGAPNDVSGIVSTGAVYIYERNSGGPDAWRLQKRVSRGGARARFGQTVALVGDTLVVGAPGNGQGLFNDPKVGNVFIFERNQGGLNQWGLVTTLGTDALNVIGDLEFGAAVALDGDTLTIGVPGRDLQGTGRVLPDVGQVEIYERNLGGANSWGRRLSLNPNFIEELMRFGHALALDGDTLAAATDGPTDLYLFERHMGGPNSWQRTRLIRMSQRSFPSYPLSIEGDRLVALDETDGQGVAVFERHQGGLGAWGRVALLRMPEAQPDGTASVFGRAVDIHNDLVVVSGFFQADPDTFFGRVYSFKRDIGGVNQWGLLATLTPASADAEGLFFGASLSLSDDQLIVGNREKGFNAERELLTIFHNSDRIPPGLELRAAVHRPAADQSVTLTATVTGSAGQPDGSEEEQATAEGGVQRETLSELSGSVEFFAGGVSLGSVAVDAAGLATLTVPGLAEGTHEITATYSGGERFSPCSAPPLLLVNGITTGEIQPLYLPLLRHAP